MSQRRYYRWGPYPKQHITIVICSAMLARLKLHEQFLNVSDAFGRFPSSFENGIFTNQSFDCVFRTFSFKGMFFNTKLYITCRHRLTMLKYQHMSLMEYQTRLFVHWFVQAKKKTHHNPTYWPFVKESIFHTCIPLTKGHVLAAFWWPKKRLLLIWCMFIQPWDK